MSDTVLKLKATLAALEADLEDLEDSVKSVSVLHTTFRC